MKRKRKKNLSEQTPDTERCATRSLSLKTETTAFRISFYNNHKNVFSPLWASILLQNFKGFSFRLAGKGLQTYLKIAWNGRFISLDDFFPRSANLKWRGVRSSLFKVKFHRPLVLKMKQLPRAILKENTKIKILNIKLLFYLFLPKTSITTCHCQNERGKKHTLCSNV